MLFLPSVLLTSWSIIFPVLAAWQLQTLTVLKRPESCHATTSSVIGGGGFGQRHCVLHPATPALGRITTRRRASTSPSPITPDDTDTHDYELIYSPNFHRHLVVRSRQNVRKRLSTTRTTTRTTTNATTSQILIQQASRLAAGQTTKVENADLEVVDCFHWLDEARAAYPMASTAVMDLPPTVVRSSTTAAAAAAAYISETVCSTIVAGGGLNETSVYYHPKDATARKLAFPSSEITHTSNGATYLLQFLQEHGASVDLHRKIMDRFPRLAFYEASHVQERLAFFLAPMMPPSSAKNQTSTTAGQKQQQQQQQQQRRCLSEEETNNLPLLFYRYGYGAGMTVDQVIRALSVMPEVWLPMYWNEASCSAKQPVRSTLPYLFFHLNVPPEQLSSTRAELDDWLTGACPVDIACWAYARGSLGLLERQCRILLQAMPTLVSCDMDPSWELRESGPVRNTLREDALAYLRLRLQCTPSQLMGLYKTHSRLSTYSVNNKLKPTLDALECQLGLSSRELQKLILRMPSMTGMALATLEERVYFFRHKVGLSTSQLKQSLHKLPSLLQYSVKSNLDRKLHFLQVELQISRDSLIHVVVTNPSIWGRSLESTLRPVAIAFSNTCDMTLSEFGDIVARFPNLYSLNWENNLRPTLDFLVARLHLSTSKELKALIQAAPRLLMHNIDTSLDFKIKLIEELMPLERRGEVLMIVRANPSLLLHSFKSLRNRLDKVKDPSKPAALALALTGAQRTSTSNNAGRSKQPSGKTVLQILPDDGNVLQEFQSVKEAAAAAGISVSYMYHIIRQERISGGKRYQFGKSDRSSRASDDKANASGDGKHKGPSRETMSRDIKSSPVVTDQAADKLLKEFFQSPITNKTGSTRQHPLSLVVSARVYPPDTLEEGRGRRRAGGMAIAIPSFPIACDPLFYQACDNCFKGQIMAVKRWKTDSKSSGVVVILGYPYLRPSRRRCSLYACRIALRFVEQLLSLSNLSCFEQPVEIVTDSNYVWNLLRNSSDLLAWGAHKSKQDYVMAKDTPDWSANPDILYPLSRTYSTLNSKARGSGAHVSFVRQKDEIEDLARWTREASHWQFERAK